MKKVKVYVLKQNGIVLRGAYGSLKEACGVLGVSYSTAQLTKGFVRYFSHKEGVTKEIYELDFEGIKGRGRKIFGKKTKEW